MGWVGGVFYFHNAFKALFLSGAARLSPDPFGMYLKPAHVWSGHHFGELRKECYTMIGDEDPPDCDSASLNWRAQFAPLVLSSGPFAQIYEADGRG